jgi:hypothetical protein
MIHSSIFLLSTPRSSEWSLPFMFSNQNVAYTFCLSRKCYMPLPSRPPLFDHHNNILWRVQVLNVLIMRYSPASCHFILGPNILFSILFSNIFNLYSSHSVRKQVSHPYKTTGIIFKRIVFLDFIHRLVSQEQTKLKTIKHYRQKIKA